MIFLIIVTTTSQTGALTLPKTWVNYIEFNFASLQPDLNKKVVINVKNTWVGTEATIKSVQQCDFWVKPMGFNSNEPTS